MESSQAPQPAPPPNPPMAAIFAGIAAERANSQVAQQQSPVSRPHREWFHATRRYVPAYLAKVLEQLRKATGVTDPQLSFAIDPQCPAYYSYMLTNGPIPLDDVFGDNVIASFHLAAFPGCCGLQIMTGLHVHYAHSHKGVGGMMLKVAQDISVNLGYTVLVATDVARNAFTRNMFVKDNWQKQFEFQNRRTKNMVETWIKVLKHP